jgi:hypothetical protein
MARDTVLTPTPQILAMSLIVISSMECKPF